MAGEKVMPGSRQASRNRVVCMDRPVPADWVVVAACHNPACPGEGVNAWVVKRPGRREVICAHSPLPAGWEVVAETHSKACPGEGPNAFVIERPGRDRG